MKIEFNERDWIELLTNISQDIVSNGICKRISLIGVIDVDGKILVASAIPGDMLEEVRISIMGMADIFKHGTDRNNVITGKGFVGVNATREMIEREIADRMPRVPFVDIQRSENATQDEIIELIKMFKEAYLMNREEKGLECAKQVLIVSAIEYSKKMVRDYSNMNIPQRVEWIGTIVSEGKEKLQNIMPNDDFSWWPEITDKDIYLAVTNT